jgi:hypothetical protein
MKKTILFAFCFLVVHSSHANFLWGTDSVVSNFTGNAIPTSPFFGPADSTAGAFAQLIRILTGSNPFAFVNSGSGIDVVNEQVVHTSFSGQSLFANEGTFEFQNAASLNSTNFNGFYYVRVFDAPQASAGDFDLGNAAPIPAGAQYYFQSEVVNFAWTLSPAEPWDFAPSGAQTLNVVPEPGVLAMMGLGLFGLATVRRRLQT